MGRRQSMRRHYESIISLDAGMILMFLGFFLYVGGGESEIVSVGVVLGGAACAFLGFVLAYLGYRAAV